MRAILAALLVVGWLTPAGGAVLQTGVNGHPLVQEGYRDVPVAVQLDLVARLGAGWYRCDLGFRAAEPEGAERLAALLREAARRHVRVLPILFPPVDLNKDDEA